MPTVLPVWWWCPVVSAFLRCPTMHKGDEVWCRGEHYHIICQRFLYKKMYSNKLAWNAMFLHCMQYSMCVIRGISSLFRFHGPASSFSSFFVHLGCTVISRQLASYAVKDVEEYRNFCSRPKNQRPLPEEVPQVTFNAIVSFFSIQTHNVESLCRKKDFKLNFLQ